MVEIVVGVDMVGVNVVDEGCDAVEVGGGHGGAGRQAEAFVEKVFGDGAAHSFAVTEHGLQMHGLPQRAGFDVLRLQGQADILSCRAELLRFHGDHGEPVIVPHPRGLGHEVDTG